MIVGIVIGVIVPLLLIAACVFMCMKNKKQVASGAA